MAKAKQKAIELYNEYYMIIFEYGEELSEECVVSLLAIKCAKKAAKELMDINYGTKNLFYEQVIIELEKL